MLAVLVVLAVAGCGEGAGNSTSVASSTKAANAATTTTAGSAATRSTAAKLLGSKLLHSAGARAKVPKTPDNTTSTSASTEPRSAAAAVARERLLQKFHAGGLGAIRLTSSAFKAGGPIDARYTCDGASISPPLQWHGVPHGAAELFLLVADIGGGTSSTVQWALAMPPSTTAIPVGSPPAGAVVGVNSAGKVGWGGVCGAKGKLQHVTFLMYGLNRKLGLKAGFNPSQISRELNGDDVATGITVATYQR